MTNATEIVIKAMDYFPEKKNTHVAKNLYLNTTLGIHSLFQEVHKPKIKNI